MVAILIGVFLVMGHAAGDEDPEDRDYERWNSEWRSMPRNVAPATNDVYARECGSCHMAYPPGLLPARSWERVMRELPSHFGDDASLRPEAVREITSYLLANASDRVASRTGTKIRDSIASGKAPLRISETRYFQRKHSEVPRVMVTENPQVKSFAHCKTCHVDADKGVFDEVDARIPGFEWVRF
ncbi:MAG: diheme cytochrome c [Ectothiorhodospiraceae bacterium]|nr:diheme cytochrome c [Ectothiorhodospiraceae bacterium]